ncbi:hypothetical protein [Chromohalobacter sp. 296-RDG]|uniref:hypothetical protein n=1 Tax=Chromohalobacter sp. 296-RDG TaxID=2994062 RepID=UPI002469AA6C|nr:hypothetical protein [Chromohalobacter sp. 296-RDG]
MVYPHLRSGIDLKIKIKQHIFTQYLIRQFAINKRVWVAFLPSWEVSDKRFDWGGSKVFRKWSHAAEIAASSYENEFHRKVVRARKENVFRSHRIANEYYAIWYVKSYLMKNELPDLDLHGNVAGYELKNSELEILESKGMTSIPEVNSKAVSRGIDRTHVQMMMHVRYLLSGMKSVRWQLVIAPDDSFVAPMSAPNSLLIPIAHNRLLCGFPEGVKHKPHYTENAEDILRLNREMVKSEENWVVSRSRNNLLDFRRGNSYRALL